MLRGKKPEHKEKRLKMFVYGKAGVGKTVASLQFPNAYIIDTEKGTDFYARTINKNNSVVFHSTDPNEILHEIKELLTSDHDYRTLIIDPITIVYASIQQKWTNIFEKYTKNDKNSEIQDFGMRYWGKVKGEYKAIQRLLFSLDMNVIITAHQKDVYGTNFSKIGVTFDAMKGDDYFFDYIFRIKKNKDNRVAITEKERVEVGENKFPEEFIWSYDNFIKFYGKEIIEKKSNPIKIATKEQVEKINKLIEIVKVDDTQINKWLSKANVSEFSEMSQDQITKCIEFLESKISGIK